ncbi:MAG: DASS family sodium-coupled anion symporter [Deltaproteobacteria bacterium]|nr:DASS family sodium-coupled anion symporter [Myxococcales bacterium]MDP3214153.1 DASS family sodium-coupled anion symporter [Deltaproteobacteria bacterium]
MSDAASLREQARRRALIVILTGLAAAAVYVLLPVGVNELARRAAAIFVVACVFWATEALPTYATALCVVALEVLFLAHNGGVAGALPSRSAWPVGPDGAPVRLTVDAFFAPLGSPIIVLFLGGLLLAAAVVKHGLDRALAVRLLSPVAGHPLRLMISLACGTALLSMWMSNTAATAMMLSIITPLLPRGPTSRYGTGLAMCVALGANLGGMTTPISTPPNAIATGALRAAGHEVRFFDWVVVSLPLAAVLVVGAAVLLYAMFPPLPGEKIDTGSFAAARHERLTWPAKATLAVLVAAMALWVTEPLHGLSPAAVALLAAAALTALGLLGREDLDHLDWNILILMWGGLSLGQAMQSTGLLAHVGALPIAHLGGFSQAAVIALLTVSLGTFMSNTATANLMVPVAMGLAPERAAELAVVTAYACSFGVALPVSTPSNAMVFASGRVPLRDMIKAGLVMQFVALGLLLLGYRQAIAWLLR